MNDNGKISVIYSWPVIILAFVIFWPVGAFLLLRRTSLDKKLAVTVAKLLAVVGIGCYIFVILGVIACISNGLDAGVVAVILFFLAAGFVIRLMAKKLKAEAESVKQYMAIIVNGGVRQLDSIAATTGKPYNTVKKEVQKMVQKGYFKNGYIDEATREIVLPASAPAAPVAPAAFGMPRAAAPIHKVVACPSCGANNTVTGAGCECEYCGAPLA